MQSLHAIQLLISELVVQEAVCDSEKATWSALKDVFLNISIRGTTGNKQGSKRKASESLFLKLASQNI